MADPKQVFIPSIKITGTYLEELGAEGDRILYPGGAFDITLTSEDFENPEDYHAVWIAITKAVKKKLQNA